MSGTRRYIEHLWAFVTTDEGGEGLAATMIDDTWYPLIAADEARLADLIPIARGMAGVGTAIKLVKFTAREEVDIY